MKSLLFEIIMSFVIGIITLCITIWGFYLINKTLVSLNEDIKIKKWKINLKKYYLNILDLD